jgi:hypothetical protein
MQNNQIDLNLLSNRENYAIHFDVSELTKYLDIEISKFKNINIFREHA